MDIGELKARFDLRAFIPSGQDARDVGDCRKQLCLWHAETRPSLLVYPTMYICKACGAKGDILDWLQFSEGISWTAALHKLEGSVGDTVYRPPTPPRQPALDPDLALDYHLNINEHALRYFQSRGLEKDTVVRFQLGYGPPPGHQEPWFTIPVYQGKQLVNIKFRRDDACPKCRSFATKEEHGILHCADCLRSWPVQDDSKYRGIAGAGLALFNSRYLYRGLQYYSEYGMIAIDKVILTEGEFDAMAAAQAGMPATCSTGGASSFRREWVSLFLPVRHIFVVYDNDVAGETGWKCVQKLLPRVFNIALPGVSEKGDLNDYLLSHPPTDFQRLLKDAEVRQGAMKQFSHIKRWQRSSQYVMD